MSGVMNSAVVKWKFFGMPIYLWRGGYKSDVTIRKHCCFMKRVRTK